MSNKTIIVVPCYNEAERLPADAFRKYAEQNPDVEFLFVNDGSSDNTAKLLSEIVSNNRQFHFLNLQKNGGKAEAVRAGMLFAFNSLESEYIGFWDADLATPLDEMSNFIKIIRQRNLDMVTGLRLLRLGTNINRKTYRHIFGRVFATVASFILKAPVYDTQCGAKLFKTDIIPTLFNDSFVSRWYFDVELLARYKKAYGSARVNEKIYENPLLSWEDVKGSRLKLTDFLLVPAELFRIWRHYRFFKKNFVPLHLY